MPANRRTPNNNDSLLSSGISRTPTSLPPSATTSTLSRPGAYSITRNATGPTQVFRVQIPHEVQPNQEFQVIAGTRTVRVRCPAESRGGHYLQITVPPDPVISSSSNNGGMAVLTCAVEGMEGGGAVRMTESVARENAQLQQQQEGEQEDGNSSESTSQQPSEQQPPTTYMVTVPPMISPGMTFAVEVEGQRMMVTCPANVQAGMNLRILPPQPSPSSSAPPNLSTARGTSLDRPPEQQQRSMSSPNPASPPIMQMFEVVVPLGREVTLLLLSRMLMCGWLRKPLIKTLFVMLFLLKILSLLPLYQILPMW